MALDKWQMREARKHADENGVELEAAVKDLFPDEPAASAPRKRAAAKVDTTKTDA
jgi:hypothetical protein